MSSARARMLALAIVATILMPAMALADGDPASDVLLGESVFYPYSPPVATGLQKTLNAETAAASRAHFPIKLALIDTPIDLGAIPTLFGKPQQYADFLHQEISFLGTKQLLLVVMPNGYGVQGLGRSATDAAATLKRPTGSGSNALAQAAIAAVPKLAAAAGDPISGVAGAPSTSASHGATELGVGALVFVAVLASTALLAYRHRQREAR
ncbi:MAG TPA: hypothetical protein VGF91_30615 [Solirubrobacteraceae bacterium]